ncbi:Uracil phosphoribosyltransferase, partial [Globisporangium splendens]
MPTTRDAVAELLGREAPRMQHHGKSDLQVQQQQQSRDSEAVSVPMEQGTWRTKRVGQQRHDGGIHAEEIRSTITTGVPPSFFLRSPPPQHPMQQSRRYELQARPQASIPKPAVTPDSRRWYPKRRAVNGDDLQVEHGVSGGDVAQGSDYFHTGGTTLGGNFTKVSRHERPSMQHMQQWENTSAYRSVPSISTNSASVSMSPSFHTASFASVRPLIPNSTLSSARMPSTPPEQLPGATTTVQTGNQKENDRATAARPQRSADTAAAASTSTPSAVLGNKRARYLRDTDRRDIIQRIENGEKQAALAREFGVTRAAICHIKKNRDEIITRYDLLVQSAKDLENRSSSKASQVPLEEPLIVREVRTHSVLLLLTTLRNAASTALTFRRAASRLTMILLEEAITSFGSTSLEVQTSTGQVFQGFEAPSELFCGVSIGTAGHSFLKLFRQMEPEAATGYIHLLESMETTQKQPKVARTDLPPNIRGCNVLLFLATSNDGESVCKSIEAMRRLDVPETSICVVLLLCTANAIAAICTQFPRMLMHSWVNIALFVKQPGLSFDVSSLVEVKIVTGAIDADARSGLGDFVARYNA